MGEKRSVPATGYQIISGKRAPPKSMGTHLFCQLRGGICCPEPWPVADTEWIHTGSGADVVAVKRCE